MFPGSIMSAFWGHSILVYTWNYVLFNGHSLQFTIFNKCTCIFAFNIRRMQYLILGILCMG